MKKLADAVKINLAIGCRLQWEEAQKSYVLLFPEGMILLNTQAVEILQLCNGTLNFETIVDRLQQKYSELDVSSDVIEFLEDFYEQGWLRIC